MTALNRKLARDLRGAAGMLLAITSIIVVGVTCYVGLRTAHHNLAEAKRRYYEQCRMADFSIELKKAPTGELAPLAELPGVAEIRPRIRFFVAVDLEDEPEPLNGLVLSLPDHREPVLNDVVLRQGTYFTQERDNEVLVNEAFARAHGLRPGQWIHLVLNNRRQELRIVGTAISSEYVYVIGPGTIVPDPHRFGIFYLKQTYAEDAFDFGGAANQVLGRLDASAEGDPREVLRRAEQALSSYGVFSTTPLEEQLSNRFLSQEIQGLRSFAVITPTMFLAVAAVVLNVLLTRLTQQQRTVIGTLKALGYGDAQLFWHLQKLGLAVGVTGGLLGCVLGHFLAEWLNSIYRRFFLFPELSNDFVPTAHALGLGISIGCAVLGSLRGSRSVLRLRPAEAMRPPAPAEGGRVFLERIGWLWRSLSSGWRMVLRDLFRSRVRTIAGIFAAAMGASVLVNAQMMIDSPYYLMDFQFHWVNRADRELTFIDERGDDALDEAVRLPGVDHAEPILSVACTFRNGPYAKKGSITGLAAGARLTTPLDLQARPIRVPESGLAMSRELADRLHLGRGDRVRIEPIKGLRQPAEVPVREITEGYLGMAVYAEIDYLSRLIGEQHAITGVQLALDGDPSHRRELDRQLKELPVLQATSSRTEMIRGFEESVLRNQWVVLALMVFFAGTVFFGSVLNASLVSLAERQREVATLRCLGYGPWQIGTVLLRESLIATLAGTFLGMPLGYLLTVFIASAYSSEMFRMPIIANGGTWAWTLAMAIVFSLVAHLFVQRSIHRMAWLDALKAQE